MALSGSILREERKRQSISQKDLARQLDVSPAYINLIENGHRALTPSLREQICNVLNIDEDRLIGQGDQEYLSRLRASHSLQTVDQNQLERLVVEMPELARALLDLDDELQMSKHNTQKLLDRIGNDERLSEKIHDLLSIATSIRSTSSILNTQGDLAAEHSSKFRDVLHQDARQLSDSLRDLVEYLDQSSRKERADLQSDLQLSTMLETRQYALEELEQQLVHEHNLDEWLNENFGGASSALGRIRLIFKLLISDIKALPFDEFVAVAQEYNWQVKPISAHFDVSIDRVIRRLAMVSKFAELPTPGLFLQDQTGRYWLQSHSIFGGEVDDLNCPLWPIFDPSCVNGVLVEARIALAKNKRYYIQASTGAHLLGDRQGRSWHIKSMLVRPFSESFHDDKDTHFNPIGLNCNNCKILNCEVRRT